MNRFILDVRTTQYSYVEYETGEKELYDLTVDPQELTSIHKSASQELLSTLKTRLDALKSCAGAGCKVAEDGGSCLSASEKQSVRAGTHEWPQSSVLKESALSAEQ